MSGLRRAMGHPDKIRDVHVHAHDLASDRLLEPLAPTDEEWLNLHLGRCQACRDFVSGVSADRELLWLLRDMPIAPPRDLGARLGGALDAEVRDALAAQPAAPGRRVATSAQPVDRVPERARQRGWRPPFALAGVAAAAVVAMLAVPLLWAPHAATQTASNITPPAVGAAAATPISVSVQPVISIQQDTNGKLSIVSAPIDKVCPGNDASACGTLNGSATTLIALDSGLNPESIVMPKNGDVALIFSGNSVYALTVPADTHPSISSATNIVPTPAPTPARTGVPASPPADTPVPSGTPGPTLTAAVAASASTSPAAASATPGASPNPTPEPSPAPTGGPGASPAATPTPVMPPPASPGASPAATPTPTVGAQPTLPAETPAATGTAPSPGATEAATSPAASPTMSPQPSPAIASPDTSTLTPIPAPSPAPAVTIPPATPAPTAAHTLAVAEGIIVMGTPAASPDGRWIAFTARPNDNSAGPDVWVWRVGSPQAIKLTSDGVSHFASWNNDSLVISRTLVAGRPAVASTDPATVTARSFLLDPSSGSLESIVGAAWKPVVDPTGRRVAWWQGTFRWSAADVAWLPDRGEIVLDDWSALQAGTSSAPDHLPASAPLIDGATWDIRWDPAGRHLAVWVADGPGERTGRLSLYPVQADGTLSASMVKNVAALRSFSLDAERLAWATPPGQDGAGSTLNVFAWSDNGNGQIISAPDSGPIVVAP